MRAVVAALGDDRAAPSVIAAASVTARAFSADVELLHVRENGSGLVAEAAATATGLTLRTLPGDRHTVLSAAAAREDVAALIIAARGTPESEPVLGTTTSRLITSLSKPVVVVPPDYAERRRHPRDITRVLVPLDGTPASAAALQGVVELAAEAEVEIVLVHVLDLDNLPAFGDQLAHEVRAWSDAFIARNAPTAPRARLELRVGRPADGIREALDESGADLVVLAWSRELSQGRALVVSEILAAVAVPVLLTPA